MVLENFCARILLIITSFVGDNVLYSLVFTENISYVLIKIKFFMLPDKFRQYSTFKMLYNYVNLSIFT